MKLDELKLEKINKINDIEVLDKEITDYNKMLDVFKNKKIEINNLKYDFAKKSKLKLIIALTLEIVESFGILGAIGTSIVLMVTFVHLPLILSLSYGAAALFVYNMVSKINIERIEKKFFLEDIEYDETTKNIEDKEKQILKIISADNEKIKDIRKEIENINNEINEFKKDILLEEIPEFQDNNIEEFNKPLVLERKYKN